MAKSCEPGVHFRNPSGDHVAAMYDDTMYVNSTPEKCTERIMQKECRKSSNVRFVCTASLNTWCISDSPEIRSPPHSQRCVESHSLEFRTD